MQYSQINLPADKQIDGKINIEDYLTNTFDPLEQLLATSGTCKMQPAELTTQRTSFSSSCSHRFTKIDSPR